MDGLFSTSQVRIRCTKDEKKELSMCVTTLHGVTLVCFSLRRSRRAESCFFYSMPVAACVALIHRTWDGMFREGMVIGSHICYARQKREG